MHLTDAVEWFLFFYNDRDIRLTELKVTSRITSYYSPLLRSYGDAVGDVVAEGSTGGSFTTMVRPSLQNSSVPVLSVQ